MLSCIGGYDVILTKRRYDYIVSREIVSKNHYIGNVRRDFYLQCLYPVIPIYLVVLSSITFYKISQLCNITEYVFKIVVYDTLVVLSVPYYK